jgi:hypothetical protein
MKYSNQLNLQEDGTLHTMPNIEIDDDCYHGSGNEELCFNALSFIEMYVSTISYILLYCQKFASC